MKKTFAIRPPSAAMVVALTALFVALGGTGYAASQLSHSPRGSAARHQVKPPSESTKDLNQIKAFFNSQKRSLVGPAGSNGATGSPGPQGPQGVQGPPGAPATTLFAFVHENGTLVRGTPGATASLLGSGSNQFYEVNFPRDVSKCVPEVSIGNTSGNGSIKSLPFARMLSDEGASPPSTVEVDLLNPSAAGLVTGAFNLIVIC